MDMEEIKKRIVEEIEKEVMKTLNLLAERYAQRRRKEIPLPYMGEREKWCGGMKTNGGLYNQCRRRKEDSSRYCKECENEAKENRGRPKEGDIKEREAWRGGRDGKGNKLESYMSIMESRGITREEAETEAMRNQMTIPEEHFEKVMRGRPSKEEKEVTSHTGEDLISRLLKEAREKEDEEEKKRRREPEIKSEEKKKEPKEPKVKKEPKEPKEKKEPKVKKEPKEKKEPKAKKEPKETII